MVHDRWASLHTEIEIAWFADYQAHDFFFLACIPKAVVLESMSSPSHSAMDKLTGTYADICIKGYSKTNPEIQATGDQVDLLRPLY